MVRWLREQGLDAGAFATEYDDHDGSDETPSDGAAIDAEVAPPV
jgi:putative mRNA 3-end processing factor